MSKVYNIDTEDNISLVVSRLKSSIEKSQFFRFEKKPGKLFEGTIQEESFKIRRITEYRKSYIPIIKGEVKETSYGANVKISMHENPLTSVFMIIWFLFLMFFLFIIVKYMTLSLISIILLIGLVFLGIIAFSITTRGSKKEFENSRRILEDVIKGKI